MCAPVLPGRIVWLGSRPARRAPMASLDCVELVAGAGMVGDRYSRCDGARQVSLIQAESLQTIASHLGRDAVSPFDLRRNLVTQGINLLALKGLVFRVGDIRLEWSGECHPCSRMEEVLGPGGYNAVRGLGGILARVLDSGPVRLGDQVTRD